jgi:hypothetical protein
MPRNTLAVAVVVVVVVAAAGAGVIITVFMLLKDGYSLEVKIA